MPCDELIGQQCGPAVAANLLTAFARAELGLALAVAGGGSSAIAALAGCPGASAVLISASLAYSPVAVAALRAVSPAEGGHCSPPAAMDLAHAALAAARRGRTADQKDLVAVGASGALTTARSRAGADRVHIAAVAPTGTWAWRMDVGALARDRFGQEQLAGRAVLQAARQAGLGAAADRPTAGLDLPLVEDPPNRDYWIGRVAGKQLAHASCDRSGRWSTAGAAPRALLPGSFDPLHRGHLGLADAAETELGLPVALELSLSNVDKPDLAPAEIARRVGQVGGRRPIVIDSAPTFVEKSRIFPGAVFVIGADTAIRVVDPAYYGANRAAMVEALTEISANGNSFLVAGRAIAGKYIGVHELDFSPAAELFRALPSSAFRLDVSSTQLRSRR